MQKDGIVGEAEAEDQGSARAIAPQEVNFYGYKNSFTDQNTATFFSLH